MEIKKTLSDDSFYVLSYCELRKIIGIIGILFPFIMIIGGFIAAWSFTIEPSISDYYYTPMRNILVGYMVSIALFLFTYRYEKKDNIAGNLAGIFAAGTAFFPTSDTTTVISIIHFLSAGLLFLTLAYFSLFIFTLSDKNKEQTVQKIIRNKVYRFSGYIMLLCLTILILYFISGLNLEAYSFVLWIETIAFISFGFSWLVKGGMFFKDEDIDVSKGA